MGLSPHTHLEPVYAKEDFLATGLLYGAFVVISFSFSSCAVAQSKQQSVFEMRI
jgi:hypothetical protein